MGLETGSYISDLVATNPVSSDDLNTVDDHIRLLKSVLETNFPGSGGSGFNKAITATEDELNYSSGLTGNIQDQLDALQAAITALGG